MGYAIDNISALPFRTLIGAPLVAAIEAQALAAKSTVDFIQDVGFTTPSDDVGASTESTQVGAIRSVQFSYQITLADGTRRDGVVTVPILSIVPIPFIAIEEVSIDFMAKISEAITHDRKASSDSAKSASTSAKGGWGPCSVGLKGSLSSKHSSTSATSSKYNTELTMNIRVRATQDDMPAGLAKILDILHTLITNQVTATAPVTPP
jgi:hypothetical protein